jgi:hypothetical protein
VCYYLCVCVCVVLFILQGVTFLISCDQVVPFLCGFPFFTSEWDNHMEIYVI